MDMARPAGHCVLIQPEVCRRLLERERPVRVLSRLYGLPQTAYFIQLLLEYICLCVVHCVMPLLMSLIQWIATLVVLVAVCILLSFAMEICRRAGTCANTWSGSQASRHRIALRSRNTDHG